MIKLTHLAGVLSDAVAHDRHLYDIEQASTGDDYNAIFPALEMAHNLMPTLLAAVDSLTYALQVFRDTCSCGECAACLGAEDIEATLEKLN